MAAVLKRTRSLIVDDDPEIIRLITQLLGKAHDCKGARDGAVALKILEEWPADLIVLDLVMKGIDGFVVCSRVREYSAVPILIVSARESETDKIRALDLGADDYITKPFRVGELLARVRALLRRSRGQGVGLAALNDGYLSIDFERHLVRVRGEAVHFTPIEYALLEQLATHPGCLMTHRQLLRAVWGAEYSNEVDYLRVYVRRIRRKIEVDPTNPQYILTEARLGYRFRSWSRPAP